MVYKETNIEDINKVNYRCLLTLKTKLKIEKRCDKTTYLGFYAVNMLKNKGLRCCYEYKPKDECCR